MQTHDLNFLRGYLAAHRSQWTTIAEDKRVARRAIAYIVDDPERDPRHSTVVKLMEWIADHDPMAVRKNPAVRVQDKDAA